MGVLMFLLLVCGFFFKPKIPEKKILLYDNVVAFSLEFTDIYLHGIVLMLELVSVNFIRSDYKENNPDAGCCSH